MTTTENTAIAIVVPEREQLPPSLLANIETGFREAFAQAEKWRVQALAINVTSADQKTEMKLARTIRLELKNIRVSAEKTRKTLKEDALRMGKAIDGVNNLLLAAIVPLEKHLEEQEQYGERLAEAERQATLARRTAELAPYLTEGQQVPALDVMSAEQFANYITDAKLLHEAKIEQSRKAEAERIAAEQAAAAERERLRIENERLRQEAAEREAAAKAEREAAEKAQREAAAKAKAERDALEAAAKAEREAADRELARIKAESEAAAKKEREAAAERQRIADEAARKERAAIQAKADAERKEAQAAMDAANATREKMEREAREKNAAEAARIKAELLAKQKANRAPDKQKALAFAATVRTLKTPEASTVEGKAVMAEITAKIEGFAKWITVQAESL
jgi:hypothetical protein